MIDADSATPDAFTGRLAHVDRDGKPLCNQVGSGLRLCSEQDFAKLPGIEQCRRCERSLGGDDYGRLSSLGPKQQAYLRQIRSTAGKDGWCAVAGLARGKGSGAWTSLHRSLRALVEIGLLENRVDKHHRTFVRLTEKVCSIPERIIFGRSKAKP